MRHRISKINFGHGTDANKMLLRKLLVNFFGNGKIQVTFKKARLLKSEVERLVEKAKDRNESNRNYLQSRLSNKTIIEKLFTEIGPAVKGKVGGYVRIKKMGYREGDNAKMAALEWVYPVVKVAEKKS